MSASSYGPFQEQIRVLASAPCAVGIISTVLYVNSSARKNS
jgi:hypothetical protein